MTKTTYQRRGGPRDQRNRVYNSRAWKDAKRRVLDRDGHQCQGHGPHRGPLSVHHIVPIVHAPHLATDDDNLITLCARCHGKIDGPRATRPSSPSEGGACRKVPKNEYPAAIGSRGSGKFAFSGSRPNRFLRTAAGGRR